MGKTAKEIVGEKVGEIVGELNKALADEWLAYMQYISASRLVSAPQVIKEFEAIAKEELEHAEELTERIIQLGGTPIVDPKQFYEKTNCGYEVPTAHTMNTLNAALKGEECAIKVYDRIAKLTHDTDPITYQLVLHIMGEEIDHEQRFGNLKEWLEK